MWYLAITSLIWAFSFSLIKRYLASYDASVISFIRLFISFLVFLPFIKFPKNNLNNRRFAKQFLIGTIQFGLMYILYIKSYKYLHGHQIALLTITTPIFVVLFDAILNKTWKTIYWGAASLVILGSAILVDAQFTLSYQWTGVLLMQAANACFALGQILQKKWGGSQLHHVFAWSYLGGLIIPLISLLITFGFSLPSIMEEIPKSTQAWTVLLYLGAISSGLCFFMWNKGVCQINSGLISIMNNLKIPLAVLVSFFIFGESVLWVRLTLGSLCFATAFYWTYRV